MDSVAFAQFTADINKRDGRPAKPMTRQEFEYYNDTSIKRSGIHFTENRYKSREQYDSLLATGAKKHNWFERQLIYREIAMNKKYDNDARRITLAFRDKLIHTFPQMLFISLPLFALILQLVYRRRKQFYYVNHAIFVIYFYIFFFAAMLLLFAMARLNDHLHWGIFTVLSRLIEISVLVYQYIALYKFYRQGWLKTFFKFLLINIGFIIMIAVLMGIMVLFSLYKI
jgi:hypothetical protein